MNRNIKFLPIILALFFIMTAIAGCTPASNPNPTEAPTTAPTAEPTPEPTEEPPPALDLGGREIRLRLAYLPERGKNEAHDELLDKIEAIEQKLNCKVIWVANTVEDQSLEAFIASAAAGTPFGDLLNFSKTDFHPTLVQAGYFVPLSDLPTVNFDDPKWYKPSMDTTLWKGKYYGMTAEPPAPTRGMYWNKTIFEREGQPNLYELMENGEWTWDKMLEIAKACTKDTDGDGAIDQWGLGLDHNPWPLVVGNGGNVVRLNPDGTGVVTLKEPAAIEAFNFYTELYNVHKVVQAVRPEGASWDYEIQQFTNGKIAMFSFYWWANGGFSQNMTDEYGFVMFPKAPRANDYVSTMEYLNVLTIPVGVDKPEEIAAFWNEMTEPDPNVPPKTRREALLASHGPGLPDQETLETLLKMESSNVLVNIWGYGTMSDEYWGGLNAPLIEGTKTAQQAVDEITDTMQAILNDVLAGTTAE